MKNRKREDQAQSSRLYLRDNDHREVIYDDKYHNFIWARIEDIKDKLVWQKFPRKALIAGGYAGCLGWMDAERQFQYATGYSSSGNKGLYYVDGLIVNIYYYSENSRETWISDDGMIFKEVNRDSQVGKPIEPFRGETAPFGEKGICNVLNPGGNTSRIEVSRFDYSEEYEKWLITTVTSYVSRPSGGWWSFLAPTEDGAIIEYDINTNEGQYKTAIYDQYFYHWTYSGERELMRYVQKVNYPSHGSSVTTTYSSAMCGNISCILSISDNVKSYGSTERVRIVAISTSLDKGANFYRFEPEGMITRSYDSDFRSNVKCAMFVRGAVFYAMWSTGNYAPENQRNPYQVVMYKSTNGISWIPVELPDYVEVDLIAEGGAFVTRRGMATKLKIAINPPNVESYHVRLHDMLSSRYLGGQGYNYLDGSDYNIMFKDSKFTNIDFYVVLHGDTSYYVYFDNEQLNGENCFAWTYDGSVDPTSSLYGMADQLQYGDYCVPYDTPTPFDPSQYPFWDYYKWTEEDGYTKVARVDLPHYPNWHVIVVEYLPQLGAVNVLYKVPRENA